MSGKILVIEDNPDNQKLVAWMLEDESYPFDTVESGEACLEQLQKAEYALVLPDISLPGIDGMEIARRIRSQPLFANLPIIACTAHAAAQEKANICEVGVNHVITKPFDEMHLKACLQRYLVI